MSEFAGLRILVVDDDSDQRFILRRLFDRGQAAEIVEALDAPTALAAVDGSRFDLIVLDIEMPGRSGIDVLPELHDAAAGTPIVILSNVPRERLATTAQEQGAVGYIEKSTSWYRLSDELALAAALTVMTTDVVSSTQLTPDAMAPAAARCLVRDHLAADDRDVVEVAELLVSELVANAITHASSAPRVDIHLRSDAVRVDVYDSDPTPPRRREPDVSGPGGRGLLLLDALAARWSSEPHGNGKVVWFELDRILRT